MREKLTELLGNVNRNKSVSESRLAELRTQLGKALPSTYEEFLRFSNGVEGFLNENAYITLWPAEDLVTNNLEYGVEEFAPGLFLIGSDGGDEAYGIDFREGSPTYGYYVIIPFIVLDWKDARFLGATFVDFINTLKKGYSH